MSLTTTLTYVLPHRLLSSIARALAYPEEGAPAGDYSVDHSAAMAVLDPQGRMSGLVQAPFDAPAIAADMMLLTQASLAQAPLLQAGAP